jgi:hypothetical protein
MTIWIAHEPRGRGINLDPLREYASFEGDDIRFVFPKDFNVSEHSVRAMDMADIFASEFDFENDVFTVVGGDPLAGLYCMVALMHEAIEDKATEINSLRYIREKDATGLRTIPKYIDIQIPTGV